MRRYTLERDNWGVKCEKGKYYYPNSRAFSPRDRGIHEISRSCAAKVTTKRSGRGAAALIRFSLSSPSPLRPSYFWTSLGVGKMPPLLTQREPSQEGASLPPCPGNTVKVSPKEAKPPTAVGVLTAALSPPRGKCTLAGKMRPILPADTAYPYSTSSIHNRQCRSRTRPLPLR